MTSYMLKLYKQHFEPATSVNERCLQFRNEWQEDMLNQFYKRLLRRTQISQTSHKWTQTYETG